MCLCMHVLHRILLLFMYACIIHNIIVPFVSLFSCDDEIINAEDKSSMTPLMLATMNKHMEVKGWHIIIVMYDV